MCCCCCWWWLTSGKVYLNLPLPLPLHQQAITQRQLKCTDWMGREWAEKEWEMKRMSMKSVWLCLSVPVCLSVWWAVRFRLCHLGVRKKEQKGMKDQSLFTAAHYNNSSSTSLGVWALREQHTIAIILHTVVPHNQPLLSPFWWSSCCCCCSVCVCVQIELITTTTTRKCPILSFFSALSALFSSTFLPGDSRRAIVSIERRSRIVCSVLSSYLHTHKHTT